MFVGHYGVSFAAKAVAPRVPLWVWFIAVQWMDVIWSILVLTGIEKVRIVPGFTEANALGSMPKTAKMRFAPNGGYAFAVGDDTWHSVDPVGPQVKTRDSIPLTYFVDSGALRILRNRGKRLGNFVLNEVRNRVG
jgi:hypothetical protein